MVDRFVKDCRGESLSFFSQLRAGPHGIFRLAGQAYKEAVWVAGVRLGGFYAFRLAGVASFGECLSEVTKLWPLFGGARVIMGGDDVTRSISREVREDAFAVFVFLGVLQ